MIKPFCQKQKKTSFKIHYIFSTNKIKFIPNKNFTFIPAFIVGFFLSLTSCMKAPDHTPHYGEEVSLEDIQKATLGGYPALPDVIKKNQSVSLDWFRVIQSNSPEVFYQRVDFVSQSTEKIASDGGPGFCWTFSVKQRQLDPATNVWKEASDPYGPLAYPSSELVNCSKEVGEESVGVSTSSTFADNRQFLSLFQPRFQNSIPYNVDSRNFTIQGLNAKDREANESKTTVTYHRLIREEGQMALPPAVAQNPTWCGRSTSSGTSVCPQQMRFLKIGFDRVTHKEGEKDVKITYTFVYSPDIPSYIYDWQPGEIFLTNQILSCAQMWLEVQSGEVTQNVPVRECMQATDFKFGY